MNIEYFDQSETNDIEVSLLVSLSVQISNLSSLFLFKRSHIPFHFKLGLFQLLLTLCHHSFILNYTTKLFVCFSFPFIFEQNR